MQNPFLKQQTQSRYIKSNIFKYICISSFSFCIFFLIFLLFLLLMSGIEGFKKYYINIDITITQEIMQNPYSLPNAQKKFISRAWLRNLPNIIKDKNLKIGDTITFKASTNASVDGFLKQGSTKLKDSEKLEVLELVKRHIIKEEFNTDFFTKGDSKIPENAGFLSAIVGSVLVMLVVMVLAFPIGIASAIYLEKFAKDTKFTKFLEININNLNAVPSIIFGLLGLAVFINFFGMPRSSALVGGVVLSIMSLPIVIVSTRSAIRVVPESISQAGYSLGLTKFQVVKDHILPNAFGGILTGLIIALAGAIGETAPLMIVGMIAFVPEMATDIFSPSSVMPAQIFMWSSSPERIYVQKTSAGILILLVTTFALNLIAIILRNKIDKKAKI